MAAELGTGVVRDEQAVIVNAVGGRGSMKVIAPAAMRDPADEFVGNQANRNRAFARIRFELEINCPDLPESEVGKTHCSPRSDLRIG